MYIIERVDVNQSQKNDTRQAMIPLLAHRLWM